MSIRKRNEFLEGEESDEEVEGGYDSEAAEESRSALTGRASKRRRTSNASDEVEDVSGGSEDEVDRDARPAIGNGPTAALQPDSAELEVGEEGEEGLLEDDLQSGLAATTKRKSSTPKSVTAAQTAAKKSGVVYISRVPPFMKPQTLKHYLAPHAPKGLGRIFLTPEDHAAHARRVKSGGNKKKSFTDGWVEFLSKRDAKVAAELLNGNIIGGKKGGFYHDDLWNMKYLRGFKWAHLTEQISNENAERAARMREEVRRTKEENRRFVMDVERGKMLEGMEGKRRAKGRDVEGNGDGGEKGGRRKSEFKQRKVQNAQDEGEKKAKEFLERAGRKIF